MRKFIGLAVVTALLWAAAAPARAVHVGPGEIEGKLRDWTTFFFDNGDADDIPDKPRPAPSDPTGTLAAVDDEVRAVFRVTSLISPWGGSTVWSEPPGEELTGILYDMKVETIYNLTGGGTVTSIAGATDRGTYLINLIPVTAAEGLTTVVSPVAGAGGRMDVYFDTSPDFTVTNPNNWVEGALGAQDSFPTITDGSPWLYAEFIPLDGMGTFGSGFGPLGQVSTATVYQILVTLTGAVGAAPNINGRAAGFADAALNNTGTLISDDQFGVPGSGADISVGSTLDDTYSGQGWPVGSEDPVLWLAYVPEPASMSLLLVGLVGGAGAYWRRRRAA